MRTEVSSVIRLIHEVHDADLRKHRGIDHTTHDSGCYDLNRQFSSAVLVS